MKTNEHSSFKDIFKSTSVFSAMSAIKIVIAIIRSKLVVVLLGSSGLGIIGLFAGATNWIQTLTSFGIGASAVREIAKSKNDSASLSRSIFVINRVLLAVSLIGALVTLFLAKNFSKIIFDSSSYMTSFMYLSIVVFCNQIIVGIKGVLQGLRQVMLLAKVNIIGALIPLICSVPLYYYLGENGIVLSMVLSAIFSLLAIILLSRSSKTIPLESAPTHRSYDLAKELIKYGSVVSMSGIAASGSVILLRTYIGRYGSLSDVGFYTAGSTIVLTYAGMVFSAMATDYFPRLIQSIDNKKQTIRVVNEQIEMALLFLGPILMILVAYSDIFISLLYTKEFRVLNRFIEYASLGVLVKSASWAFGYLILAFGERKIILLTELIFLIYYIVISLVLYRMCGINGLGVALLLSNLLFMFQNCIVCWRRYRVTLNRLGRRILFLELLGLIGIVYIKNSCIEYTVISVNIILVLFVLISARRIAKRLNYFE